MTNLDKPMWQHRIGQKSWDNVEQQCLNNVFTLLCNVNNSEFWILNVLKIYLYSLDYFQTYLNVQSIF